jgi:three-Cys-motif partner protein
MPNSAFFDELKPWSKRKHRLLGKYLPPFIAKVASVTQDREIFCIDCFAGAAKYDDGNEGSPLLMARVADEGRNWQNPVNLRLVNIEPNKDNYISLKQHTKPWEEAGVVRNINGEFGESLEEIIYRMGDTPALFFIDPFGPKTIPFSVIRNILTRRQSITELIINFDADGLRRIADSAVTFSLNQKVMKSNETKNQLVTEILGSDRWLSIFKNPALSTADREKAILDEYVTKLTQYNYKVVAYPIREEIDKKPQYYFIYCTRHFDGVALMNDFVRQEEDLIYGEYVESSLSLFAAQNPLAKAESERRGDLKQLLFDYLATTSSITRKELKKDLIPKYFGQFGNKDYTSVVQELIDKKILKERTKGKTRINDDDVLDYFPSNK